MIENIDIYEFAALSGDVWGLFFVDMYHSRKSRLVPEGFQSLPGTQQLTGFNHFWDDFPLGFADQKQLVPADLRMVYAPISTIEHEMRGRTFERPELHDRLVQAILAS